MFGTLYVYISEKEAFTNYLCWQDEVGTTHWVGDTGEKYADSLL